MELKVGMYVRYKDHDWLIDTIGTISELLPANGYVIREESCWARKIGENTDRFSHNIIDLIEVGDIVTFKNIFGEKSRVEVDKDFKILDIKQLYSIVTHEQFKSVEYRIGDTNE